MTTKQVSASRSQARSEARKKRKIARLRREARRREVSNKSKEITLKDLDSDQLLAYEGILEWWNTMQRIGGVSEPLIIGGYAGTGKSTLLSIAIPALVKANGVAPAVRYCAYMGKAVDVLIKKGLPASTIHSLIYNCYKDPENPGQLITELKHPDEICADLIVVDEASQVNDEMREDLESLGIPILYTGDHGQLKPVTGEGFIMANPHFKLETPHRTALESGIIQVATDVRTGKMVEKGIFGKNNDAVKVSAKEINNMKLLAKADMVICYKNDTRHRLNKEIRKAKSYDSIYPTKGERIICIKNNRETGMFNGLVLYVTSSKLEDGYLIMSCVDEAGKVYDRLVGDTNYFLGEEHPKFLEKGPIDLFEFAYAITGHKSQGSEWEDVVVVEEMMFRQKLEDKKRWMYTAITRASKHLTWISRFN